MTELQYYKALLDYLGRRGVVTEQHLKDFMEDVERQKRLREAKDFVDENFKGMF